MRRLGQVLAVLGVLAVAAAGLAVVFRAPLLEALLPDALAARGIPEAVLRIERLGWREAVITDVSLGRASELRARRARIAYDTRDLLEGRIEAVDLEGAALTLDLSGEGPLLGSLAAVLPEDPGGEEAPAPPLPELTLKDGRITLITPRGPVSGALEARAAPAADGGMEGALSFDLAGAGGRLRGHAEAVRGPDDRTWGVLVVNDGALSLAGPALKDDAPSEIALSGLRGAARLVLAGLTPETAEVTLGLETLELAGVVFDRFEAALNLESGRLEARLHAETLDRGLSLGLRAGLEQVPEASQGVITLDADLAAGAAVWPLLSLPTPERGTVNASLALAGPLPDSLAAVYRPEAGAEAFLAPGPMARHLTLRLRDIDDANEIQGLSADVTLHTPAVTAHQADSSTLTLSLEAAQLESGNLSARDIAVQQTIGLDVGTQDLELRLRDRGFFSAEHLLFDERLASDGPLRIDVLPVGHPFAVAPLPLDLSEARAIDLKLQPDPFGLKIDRPEADDLSLQAEATFLHVTGAYGAGPGFSGRVAVQDGRVVLPLQEAAAESVQAALQVTPGGETSLSFDIGAVTHTAEPPLIAPLSLKGGARLSGDAVTFSALATGPERIGAVSISGRHGTESGAGRARILLDTLSFVPGGAQPGSLIPALEALDKVTGTAQGRAEVSWDAEGLEGTAAFGLKDVSFDGPGARVEGLSLGLKLDRVAPPGSPPGQSLTVRRIDPGVPLDDLRVRFQLVPGDPPALAIADAGFNMAGGRFVLADVVVDPSAEQQDLPVRVEALDLAEVFGLLGVEGLSGDGRLSGTLPLRIEAGLPGIKGASLAAAGPGRLQVRSAQVRQTLSAAGESADLLLQALEDFHYEELTVSIDQPTPEEAVVGLSLLGNNPAVLDGYPFRFNINLETNPQKLLAALWEAYKISDRALRQMWMLDR